MALGPGKYDAYADHLAREIDGDAVVVVVLGGKHGNGCSVKVDTNAINAQFAHLALAEQLIDLGRTIKAEWLVR